MEFLLDFKYVHRYKKLKYVYARTHTRMHTHIRAHTHIHVHTRTHRHTQAYSFTFQVHIYTTNNTRQIPVEH